MSTKIKSKISNIASDQDIIDLPGSKLLEWLIDRNKIQQHWKRSQPNLLKLINNACEISSIEKKEYNYFDCKRIFKEFECSPGGGSTTLFGGYSNVNTQKWYEVIKAYEKDNYHIAESCQILSQNLNYEIPNLKKIIEKSIKTIEEESKKPYLKSKQTATTAFKKACTDLGIKGEKIRDEIVELPLQLVPLFNEAVDLLSQNKLVLNAIEFYTEILNLTKVELGNNNNDDKSPLPLLLFLIKYGNVTMDQRERILNPQTVVLEGEKEETGTDINKDSSNNQPNLEIDWCITEDEEQQQQQPTIVWEDNYVALMDSTTNEIQWDDDFSMDNIEIIEESSNTPPPPQNDKNNNDLIELVADSRSSIIKEELQNPNETILEYRPLRNQFLDELFELEIFLAHRSNEMEKSNSIFGIDQISNECNISVSQCKEYLKVISDILGKLSNTRVKQILEIKSSKKFVDRLVLQFSQKQQNIVKYNQLITESDLKIEELNLTLGQSRNKLDQLNKETRSLKSNLEPSISNFLFDKKKINLMIPFSIN